jgi:hypothetical protein
MGRATIRIFFPGARDEMQDEVFLTKTLLAPFFDLAVRPAAARFCSAHFLRTWPPDYASEETRAVKPTGIAQFSGQNLNGRQLKRMIPEILELVDQNDELTFARGCFWMVEIKGVKGYTTHPPPTQDSLGQGEFLSWLWQYQQSLIHWFADNRLLDPENDPRTLALGNIFDDWEYGNFGNDDQEWNLDIATTVSLTRRDGTAISALIKKDAHPEIIRHFTQRPIGKCIEWTRSDDGRDYQFDETAHLGSVGGFRLTVPKAEKDEPRYFQAYTTEKSLTYHRHGSSVALNSSPWRVLDDWEAERKRFFKPTWGIFDAAAKEGTTSHVAVRFESRVPFKSYPVVHHKIPAEAVQEWLYYFDTRSFW